MVPRKVGGVGENLEPAYGKRAALHGRPEADGRFYELKKVKRELVALARPSVR